jgi:hypothetical protein
MRASVEFAQFGQRLLGDSTCAIGCLIYLKVMDNYRYAIRAEMYIQLNAICTKLDCPLKGRQGVLRRLSPRPSVGKVEKTALIEIA